MDECNHRFGVIFAQTKDSRTRIVNRKSEIDYQKNQMFSYPNLPESLWIFNFCPDCGKKLM